MSDITVIVDNSASTYTALTKKLYGEWGFSAVVNHEDRRILYDTGLSGDVLIHNMNIMGIDPESIDDVILSHNHNDHTGGLKKFLEYARPGLNIFAHPSIFRRTLINVGLGFHDVGPDFDMQDLKDLRANFIPVEREFKLTKNMIISGEIPRSWGPTHNRFIYDSDGAEDPVRDDMALYIKTGNGLIALTGCGHAGIENIMEYGLRLTQETTIRGLIGGLHLLVYDYPRMEEAVNNIKKRDPRFILPAHCTGNLVEGLIHSSMAEAYKPGGVGTVFNIMQ